MVEFCLIWKLKWKSSKLLGNQLMWYCSTQFTILCYPHSLRNIFLFFLGQRLDQVVIINQKFISGYSYCKNIRWTVVSSRHKEWVLIFFQYVYLNYIYWFCLSFFYLILAFSLREIMCHCSIHFAFYYYSYNIISTISHWFAFSCNDRTKTDLPAPVYFAVSLTWHTDRPCDIYWTKLYSTMTGDITKTWFNYTV